jgi:hypothetical protein
LKDVFAAVPQGVGIFWALSRHFVPRPGVGFFAERMTARVSTAAPINDPTSPYRPHAKAAHRGDPTIRIGFGSHTVFSDRLTPVTGWHPAEVFHFPFRTLEQYERKSVRRVHGDKPLGQYVRANEARAAGRIAERFLSLVVDDATLARGEQAGSLVVDTRLRDALRRLRNAEPASGESSSRSGLEGDVAVEAAALRDADLVRVLRSVDGLRARVDAIEERARGRQTTAPE